jgi:glycosyltransferase involved in cell wall biosynthesis
MVGNFLSAAGRYASSQNLASELRSAGFEVTTTSGMLRRIPRLVDMLKTVITRRHEYDLAHVDVFSGPAFVWAQTVCFALRCLRKPYVLTLRGGNLPAFARSSPRRVERLLRSAAAVTAPSGYLCEQLKQFRPDLVLIPNGLDVGAYRLRPLREAKPRLLWLRAFHAIYNPVLAARVMAELLRDVPEASLTMVGPDKGDGAFQAVVEEAAKLGVAKRIQFPGPIPRADVPSRMAEADIFINTTNIDNTPVSVLEAMASGLCVVSTNVGGVPYLLEHGKDALLVSPDDSVAMAGAIRRVLNEPALAETLSRNARMKAEQFDWPVVVSRWEALLSAVSGSP